jgi:hypothetical protein
MATLARPAPGKGAAKRHERRDVFISYSREDRAFAELLHRRLVESGKTVYVDVRDIPKWSEDWQEELFRQIDASDMVVAVLTEAAVTSAYVAAELDHAAAEGKRLKGLKLAEVPDEQVPAPVRTGQWIDFSDREAFEERFADLLEVLATDVDWVQKHTRFGIDAKGLGGPGRGSQPPPRPQRPARGGGVAGSSGGKAPAPHGAPRKLHSGEPEGRCEAAPGRPRSGTACVRRRGRTGHLRAASTERGDRPAQAGGAGGEDRRLPRAGRHGRHEASQQPAP